MRVKLKVQVFENSKLIISKRLIFPIRKQRFALVKDFCKEVANYLIRDVNSGAFYYDYQLRFKNFFIPEDFEISKVIRDNDALRYFDNKFSIKITNYQGDVLMLTEKLEENENSNLTQENELHYSKLKLLNFLPIPSDLIENQEYLQDNYPELFIKDSIIKFRRIEFFEEYKRNSDLYAKIISFSEESNIFLLKIIYSDNETEVVHASLKDFVSLEIQSDKTAESPSKATQELGTLKRQIEYYFSIDNLSKDHYLTSHFDEENCMLRFY